MKATRKNIAETAGVSLSTVGMILSGQGARYHEDTRKRVLQAAADLGYQPSINARAFRLKRSLLLGVLINEVNTHLAAQFLQGVQDALAPTDYSPLVFFTKDLADQEQCLNRCLNRHVDGLLVNCTVGPTDPNLADFIQLLADSNKPAVEVFGHFLPNTPKVNIDNAASGHLCTRHLIDQGHRRIALLTHSRYRDQALHNDAWQQSCGYHAALKSAGLVPMIHTGDLDFSFVTDTEFLRIGFNALETLQALPKPPTAVVCYSDTIAFGLIRACRMQNLRVPDDLSIMGNTDVALSSIVNPPLTTTLHPFFKIGRTAATHLLQAIEGAPPVDTLIAPSLIERQSTAPPVAALVTTRRRMERP